MAKTTKKAAPSRGPAHHPVRKKTSSSPQEKIAVIDRQLLELVEQRTCLLRDWMRAPKSDSPATAFPPVWQQQSDAVEAMSILPESSLIERPLAHGLMKYIASASYHSVAVQDRIAYLGPIYSYSYLAAAKHFGETAQFVPVASICAVFDEIVRHQAIFGVVPIENSTDGRVVDTLTMFARLPIQICHEVLLPIHHYLLGRCPRSQIREVYSKPQAISQCRGWLAQHVPDARIIEVASTTAAARLAAEKESVAAIASREAGIQYGLDVIDACIEDNSANVTRFAVIGNQAAEKSIQDKTSLMFQLPHKPGALADAMILFRKGKLNLTWIESFPIINSPSEYLFFVEFEGHQSQKNVTELIAALRKQCLRIEVLGSYPKASL